MDLIPYLSVTPGKMDHFCMGYTISNMEIALAFRKWLGGEENINGYTHRLAFEGGKYLAQILGTEIMDKTGEATLCAVCLLVFSVLKSLFTIAEL
jgi:hypothetical protein